MRRLNCVIRKPSGPLRPINRHYPLKSTRASFPPRNKVPLTKKPRHAHGSTKNCEKSSRSNRHVYQFHPRLCNYTNYNEPWRPWQTFHQHPQRCSGQNPCTKQGNPTNECVTLPQARLHGNFQHTIRRRKERAKVYLNCVLKDFGPSCKDTSCNSQE